jgi:hypothetical protein
MIEQDEGVVAMRQMSAIMAVPEGFVADISALGPCTSSGDSERDAATGWHLFSALSEEPLDVISERRGGLEQAAVALLMRNDPDVYEVKLWRGMDCVWAAVRDAA